MSVTTPSCDQLFCIVDGMSPACLWSFHSNRQDWVGRGLEFWHVPIAGPAGGGTHFVGRFRVLPGLEPGAIRTIWPGRGQGWNGSGAKAGQGRFFRSALGRGDVGDGAVCTGVKEG
jgi:hypothetical protein